jgi:hypothetical protein
MQRTEQLCVDSLKYTIHVLDDLVVPDSNDTITFPVQPPGSCIIAQCIGSRAVLRTVKFNDHTRCQASKIGNVRTDRDLAAKMRSFQPESPQLSPQELLCIICSLTKPAGTKSPRLCDALMHSALTPPRRLRR